MSLRLILFVGCLGIAACNTTTSSTSPEPQPENVAVQPSAAKTRPIAFTAENNGVSVVAKCTVRGPEFNRSFDTPARLDIPVDASGRALISSVTCDSGGLQAVANDIPGPQTKKVTAWFGGSGLFGDRALLFGPGGNQVQYFVRDVDEGVIKVGRAPDP